MKSNELQKEYSTKIPQLINELNQRLIERDELSRLVVLAMLSKSHMFLIGERGVAKSMTVELINGVIQDSSFWQLQVNDETKIEELFGEKRSDDDGSIGYSTKQSMLSSNYVVLDEMFKARPELLNGLLEVLVDGTFTSGDGKKRKTPLVAVFGTSNEYPTETKMLPYVDRFPFWFEVKRIQEPENRKKYYAGDYTKEAVAEQYFTLEDVDVIAKEAKSNISIPEHIIYAFDAITSGLIQQAVKTSDRKYEKVLNSIIKTCAYLNNREAANTSDLFLLLHTSWHDEYEKSKVQRVVFEKIFGSQEVIKGLIQNIEKRIEEIDIYKNNHLFDYMYYKKEIEGYDKALTFKGILDRFSEVYDAYINIIQALQNLYLKYEENLKIEKELEDNYFIKSYKQNCFTEQMLEEIKMLYSSVSSKVQELEVWYGDNNNLYDYQAAILKKTKGENSNA